MIFTSFKDYSQNMAYPPTWLPDPWYWGNYKEALFEVVPYFKYFFNSAFIVVIGVAATVVTCTMVAYGFARFRCRENKYLFIIVLSTMMLPTQVTMISSYWIWAQVKMVDTYVPLLIGAFFGGSAFYIFLVRQFVMSVPRDFEEAARVDGAGTARIFLTITLPMLNPLSRRWRFLLFRDTGTTIWGRSSISRIPNCTRWRRRLRSTRCRRKPCGAT